MEPIIAPHNSPGSYEGDDEHGTESLLSHIENTSRFNSNKRAKTEKYDKAANQQNQSSENLLTQFFESPFGTIRRMWSGFSNGN